MKDKIQKFLDWLITKTQEKKLYWRQERWGSEFFTCTIKKDSGTAVVYLIAKDHETKKDFIIKIEFHKGPPVGPVTFLFGDSEAPQIDKLPQLYNAVKECVKEPEWLREWINEIMEDEEV